MPNSSRRFRPQFEMLENRLTPAGNVTASLQLGSLVILGDNRDNAIMITQSSQGVITVTPTDSTTLINGRRFAVAFRRVPGDVVINLKGGSDVVQLGADKGDSLILPRNLQIGATAWSGNDTVVAPADLFVGGNVLVSAGNGDDTFEFTGQFYVHGSMNMTGGGGNNSVTVVPTGGTNTVAGNFTVTNSQGNSTTSVFDTSVLGNLNMTSRGSMTADGTSDIFFGVSSGDVKAAVLGSASLTLNQGGGSINLLDTNVAKDVTINAAANLGAAGATAAPISVSVGPLVNDSDAGIGGNLTVNAAAPIFLQLGNQEGGAVRNLAVAGTTRLATGDGDDNISVTGLISRLATVVTTAGGTDQMSLDDSQIFAQLIVNLGTGADSLMIEGKDTGTGATTQIMQRASVNLADGDDSLLVGVLGDATRSLVVHDTTVLDGGTGFNTLLNAGANLTDPNGSPTDGMFVNFQ